MDQLLKEPLGLPCLKVFKSDGDMRVTGVPTALNRFSARARAVGCATAAVRVITDGLAK